MNADKHGSKAHGNGGEAAGTENLVLLQFSEQVSCSAQENSCKDSMVKLARAPKNVPGNGVSRGCEPLLSLRMFLAKPCIFSLQRNNHHSFTV